MYEEVRRGVSDQDLKYLFDILDTKSSGHITATDIVLLFQVTFIIFNSRLSSIDLQQCGANVEHQ